VIPVADLIGAWALVVIREDDPAPDCPAFDQERGCMCREPEEDCPVQDEEVQP
jgi:hypothetical protein